QPKAVAPPAGLRKRPAPAAPHPPAPAPAGEEALELVHDQPAEHEEVELTPVDLEIESDLLSPEPAAHEAGVGAPPVNESLHPLDELEIEDDSEEHPQDD